ncbi:ATP-binding protein [Flavobacterium sp.]|uniref:ATP-binding protein n=1 Tax=Flavobacterium sp. TaxID=239 RepID=UPI0039E343D3
MKIKDIVNRDIVNLTNCDHEPIHIPGSIQPHGFLLGIHPESRNIAFCSGNVETYLGVAYLQLLDKNFDAVFGPESAQLLTHYIHNNLMLSAAPLKMVLNGTTFQCGLHHNGKLYILEAEPVSDHKNLTDVYSQTVQFVSYMNNTHTLKDLCDLVAKGTREITGYDRVMVYRFDKEYNGEVFAESCRNDLEPFLGLHYPHTDIPPQARELYLKNLLRIIVDINYTPVPIYTIDDTPGKNLDMSLSVLRSTSPIHVEYLQNMGVGATLTISLIHRGKLWGLIACHHYSPKNISPEIRLAAQLQGQFITSQIEVRQSNEEYEISRRINISLEKINSLNLPPIHESFKIISINPDLLRLCNAAGVSLLIGNKLYTNGLTPTETEIKTLSAWLSAQAHNASFSTDKLIHFLPDMRQLCETVSGIVYHSLGNDNNIIWYRPENLTEVNWGGDPNKAIIKDEKGLHPRNSFNLWKQIVKNRSKDWLQPELNAAANFAHTLQKQIGLLLLSEEEEKSRNLNNILKATNAELENINWISTHDLQEPLRKIQLISSRLLTKEDEHFSDSALDALQRINNSANRMQTLLIDILKYTRIKYTQDAFEPTDLNAVLEDVLADFKEVIREKNAEITFDRLPVIDGIPFLLKQLFSNIILNSLKYAAAERHPVIRIAVSDKLETHPEVSHPCHVIRFADNGIGFNPKYADNIFNIFSRLHSIAEYAGSGVGLALCRKIMQTHEGGIWATGVENEGATFTLLFPCKSKN